jgi:hypothetical protein
MQVSNEEWTLAGAGEDVSLVMQNVGTTRIAFVFAVEAPDAEDIALDSDEHFILNPGSEAITITDLDTYAKNVYVRSLGPIFGKLAVEAN